MTKSISTYRIAFIAAQWHKELVDTAVTACHAELVKSGVTTENITSFEVPGSLELPLTSKLLAKTGDYDAIINFGLIVDGGIYRHEFVAQSVIQELVRAATETGVPVLSSVLTPQKFDENDTKDIEFFRQHLKGKGTEVAKATLGIIKTVQMIARN